MIGKKDLYYSTNDKTSKTLETRNEYTEYFLIREFNSDTKKRENKRKGKGKGKGKSK